VSHATPTRVGRRAFLANGSLLLATGLSPLLRTSLLAGDDPKKGRVRVGLVTAKENRGRDM
jgi:hypothetical protein